MNLPKILTNLFLIVLVSIPVQLDANAQGSEFILTSWNKKANQYRLGDRFSFKVIPRLKSFIYVFYIDHTDASLALYPGQVRNLYPVSPEHPLTVSSLSKGVLKIDAHKGYLVTVAIKDNPMGKKIRNFVLGQEDFNQLAPYDHRLDITGKQLIDRFKMLKTDHPNEFHFVVEDAPTASATK